MLQTPDIIGVRYSNVKATWLGWPFKYQTFWTTSGLFFSPVFRSPFKNPTTWQPDTNLPFEYWTSMQYSDGYCTTVLKMTTKILRYFMFLFSWKKNLISKKFQNLFYWVCYETISSNLTLCQYKAHLSKKLASKRNIPFGMVSSHQLSSKSVEEQSNKITICKLVFLSVIA